MPTSSQFLILEKKLYGLSASGRSSQCLFKEEAKCSVASVFNLGGNIPLSVNCVTDHDAVQFLGKESGQLFKSFSLPRGFTSILSSNNLSGLLQWQALGGSSAPSKISPRISDSMIEMRSQDEQETGLSNGNMRPNSALSISSSRTYVDPLTFEYLIQLGFSRSTLAKRKDCVFDSISTRRAVSAKLGETKSWRETKTPSQTTELDNVRAKPKSAYKIRESTGQDDVDPTDDFFELSFDDADADADADFYRIKPSMYMRSDKPEPRPRAAIFSFRDNEFSSHAEVKYLIETQIGVKVKFIQFDPLDVRTVKPGIHSRWIVEFFSDWDLHQALKYGLTVGKDKLIFYKHDEIAKREMSSFKYYMTIQEAKKKLKSRAKSSHSKRVMKSDISK